MNMKAETRDTSTPEEMPKIASKPLEAQEKEQSRFCGLQKEPTLLTP